MQKPYFFFKSHHVCDLYSKMQTYFPFVTVLLSYILKYFVFFLSAGKTLGKSVQCFVGGPFMVKRNTVTGLNAEGKRGVAA